MVGGPGGARGRAAGTDWSLVSNILRLRTTITGSTGAPYLSTTYWTRTDSSSAGLAADAVAAFWESIASEMSSDLSWNVEGFCDVIDDATGTLVGIDTIGGGNSGDGGDTGEPLPFATQGLLQLRTGVVVGGRALRGRLFIPGATEGKSTDGVPSSDYRSEISSAYSAMMAVSGAEMLIWSRKNGTSSPVTGGSPWNQWAVLRSRRD